MVSGTRRKGEEKKDPPAKASNNRWAVLAGDDDEDDDEDESDQGRGAKGELSARYYCELKSTASQDHPLYPSRPLRVFGERLAGAAPALRGS